MPPLSIIAPNLPIQQKTERRCYQEDLIKNATMPDKYGNVEEMVAVLPREERALVNRLRAIVMECIPKATEKAYYGLGVPFYSHNRLICFIWPPSVQWDPPSKKKESRNPKGVSLGFNQGNRMSNEDGALLAEGRKQVYILYIKSMKELDENQVRALLFEAAMIDEEFALKKKARKR
jgi:hypothetical protein